MDEREYSTQYSQERIPQMDKNLRFYLRKELRGYGINNSEEIIRKIEELENEKPANPRETLIATFENVFNDKTILFVNRLMGYQKKMCRNGASCHRMGCYFKHPSTNENMMEIETESPVHRRENRYSSGGDERYSNSKALLDKQRMLLDMLRKRSDIPPDVLSVIDQIKKITNRIKPGALQQFIQNEPVSARFILSNRKEWMTQAHLSTYPGVISVSAEGIVECETPEAAENVAKIITKIDHTVRPTWI